jgi:hypothetical protein
VKKRKGLSLTLEQANAHQIKHGFKPIIAKPHDEKKPAHALRIGTRKMNQTEREFNAILTAQKIAREIDDFRFEGVRLPWGDGMLFKADFAVRQLDRTIKLIEVKGTHIWKHAIVRFKGCRAEWKDWFTFEFWRRDENRQWHQLA